MDFRIYVINLARATDRLAAMRSKLDELGLPFERIDAVDGRAMSVEERMEFARLRARANGWLPGAIGCFRSHFQAWNRIAEDSAGFGVVFEDDVHISSSLPMVVTNLGKHLGHFDIVRFEGTRHRVLLDMKESLSVLPISLYGVRSETWGAGAYAITRDAARLLLVEPVKSHSPVDFFLFDKRSSAAARRHRIFQSVPALCVQSKFDLVRGTVQTQYGSDIEHGSDRSRWQHRLRIVAWRVRGLKNLIVGYRRIRLSDDIVRH